MFLKLMSVFYLWMKTRCPMSCNQEIMQYRKRHHFKNYLQPRWKDPYRVLLTSSCEVTEGNWLLDSYFPLRKGPCTGLVYWEDCWPQNHLKTMFKQRRKLYPQQDKKTTSEVDSYLEMPDLTHMIIYSVFLISWTFA